MLVTGFSMITPGNSRQGWVSIAMSAMTNSLPLCIFCDKESGSPEHLWPDWMHNLVKFRPINMQEADGPILYGQDPEQKITTVCHDCNTGWMGVIENKASTRLKPMLLNQPIEIDRGGMKLLTEWVVLRAMVFESIKPKSDNEQFFTREERIAFKKDQTIPGRTRVWVGALENIHIGYHGTDFNVWKSVDDHTKIGTGSVGTIYAGHILMHTVTEHIHPPFEVAPGTVIPGPPGPWDERLVGIYPRQPTREPTGRRNHSPTRDRQVSSRCGIAGTSATRSPRSRTGSWVHAPLRCAACCPAAAGITIVAPGEPMPTPEQQRAYSKLSEELQQIAKEYRVELPPNAASLHLHRPIDHPQLDVYDKAGKWIGQFPNSDTTVPFREAIEHLGSKECPDPDGIVAPI